MNKEKELLERWVSQFGNLRHDFDLLTATKELLAQQEPVAWRCNLLGNVVTDKPADNNSYTPLYKSPPKRKTLSGKESEALWEAEFKSAISYLVFDEICVAINQHTV